MAEIDFPGEVRRGDHGEGVRRLQEWLTLRNHAVRIDGDFGPATEGALKKFQLEVNLKTSGQLSRVDWDALIQPMNDALAELPAAATLGEMMVAYAMQHLAAHPREVGGQNCGPWVRLYMGGNQGAAWPWCAGFASFCMRQAARTLKAALPIEPSFSCDLLATSAKAKGVFVPGGQRPAALSPGSFFLVRRHATDWIHTGLVTAVENEIFHTIEGNTNDDGSREGFEVARRTRAYAKVDFIRI